VALAGAMLARPEPSPRDLLNAKGEHDVRKLSRLELPELDLRHLDV
jgi:hypothetical protein